MTDSPKTIDSEDWEERLARLAYKGAVDFPSAVAIFREAAASIRTAAYREDHKHGEGLASMAYEANYKKGRESALSEALEVLPHGMPFPGTPDDIWKAGWDCYETDAREAIARLLDT